MDGLQLQDYYCDTANVDEAVEGNGDGNENVNGKDIHEEEVQVASAIHRLGRKECGGDGGGED